MTRMIGAVLAMAGLYAAGSAFAGDGQHVCGQCGPRPTAYGAPACSAPNGYGLAPGCCEFPPKLCANPWANYCEEKARWQACFAQCGQRKSPCGRPDCRSCAVVTVERARCDAQGSQAPGVPAAAPSAPASQESVAPGPTPAPPVPQPQAAGAGSQPWKAATRQVWEPVPVPMTMRPNGPLTR